MADIAALKALIEPAVEAAGFAPVRVALFEKPRLTLQVMAEDPATGQMTIDQCASLSRRLSLVLDAADPIDGEYSLEVSSPGIDRPLTRLADFGRWVGHVARLELSEAVPIDGATRKRFQGPLLGIAGEDVRINAEGVGPIALPFAALASAKLVLTDALIAATGALSTEGAEDFEEEAADEPAAQRMN